MADFQRGFLNQPRGGASREPARPRSFIAKFWQDEIVHPQKIEGNMSIAWGVSVFVAGIVFAKTVAVDMIVPTF